MLRDRVLLRVVALGGVLIAVVWYAVIDFNDHAFRTDSRPAFAQTAVGHSVYIGLPVVASGDAASLTVNLRSVAPHIRANAAHATVEVMVCTGTGAGALLSGTASVTKDACTTLTPYRRGTISLTGTSGIVLVVTPHRRGAVHIDGAELHYWRGIHFGHQQVGTHWTITAA